MRINGSLVRAIVRRWVGYLALWVALIGLDPLDLVVGGFAAAVAAWASLRLLPRARIPFARRRCPGSCCASSGSP